MEESEYKIYVKIFALKYYKNNIHANVTDLNGYKQKLAYTG